MSTIDSDGMLVDPKVLLRRFPSIEHGDLDSVSAIVVHQTDSASAQHTFNGYVGGGNGAHFLIDKDGRIYQTASTKKRCYHVGRLIKSKCLQVDRTKCDSATMAKILALSWTKQIEALDAHERTKPYPDRYPVNSDSVGIELVGKAVGKDTYEVITPSQTTALQWLVSELYQHFSLRSDDVYRHPEVSYKNPGEASSATWK